MKNTALPILIIVLLMGCSENKPGFDREDGIPTFTVAGMEEHLKTLASDAFMGRMPFTEGETKTLAYLEEQLKQLGIEPGNGSTYLQEVPLVNITTTAAPAMTVKSKKRSLTLEGLKDYV
ncbi:MAG: peptidase M28, partial [Cyclobacteriaceae bacterium]